MNINYSKPEVLYIASPYLPHDPTAIDATEANALMTERYDAAKQTVIDMWNAYPNTFPFSPIAYSADIGFTPLLGWYHTDLIMLSKADKLVLLKLEGWHESKGVALEIAFAKENGIPIYEWKQDTHLLLPLALPDLVNQ